MTHTWCNWLDTRPTSVTAATPPLTRDCYANAQPDASVVHVFWRLAQDASVAGWPRPRSCTKGALFKPEPAALKAAATEEAVTQRNTHYTRIPQNKKGCEMLTPLCFPHSGRSVWMGQLLRSHLGSIHFSIVSCSFKLTGGKLSWNVWLIIASSNIRAKSLSVVKRHSNSCWGSYLQFAVVFSTCCGSSVYMFHHLVIFTRLLNFPSPPYFSSTLSNPIKKHFPGIRHWDHFVFTLLKAGKVRDQLSAWLILTYHDWLNCQLTDRYLHYMGVLLWAAHCSLASSMIMPLTVWIKEKTEKLYM